MDSGDAKNAGQSQSKMPSNATDDYPDTRKYMQQGMDAQTLQQLTNTAQLCSLVNPRGNNALAQQVRTMKHDMVL